MAFIDFYRAKATPNADRFSPHTIKHMVMYVECILKGHFISFHEFHIKKQIDIRIVTILRSPYGINLCFLTLNMKLSHANSSVPRVRITSAVINEEMQFQ